MSSATRATPPPGERIATGLIPGAEDRDEPRLITTYKSASGHASGSRVTRFSRNVRAASDESWSASALSRTRGRRAGEAMRSFVGSYARPLVDYTRQPLVFKVRKALRYVRLYGVGRTRVKIESHYHMTRRYSKPPAVSPDGGARHVGLLGCGKYAYAQIAYFLKKNYGDVIYGAMDVDLDRAASLAQAYNLAMYTDDASRIIEHPSIDTIFIASNHASHAEYAIEALRHGKTVHIEKPHVVSDDQLERLTAAMEESGGRVALGFNRPMSPLGIEIRATLEAQTGSAMLNWFVAGHEIPADHWYFAPAEGGRILGNLCHWTDFVYQMIPEQGRFPIEVNPTRAAKADSDIAVTYTFGDDSIAAITFSAKGHTFEGVKERFAAHRGDALITMDDFREATIQVREDRRRIRHRRRDHGHERMIRASYELGLGHGQGASVAYVWETAQLFLRTRDALEESRAITIAGFDRTGLARPA
jgi:predicted dehydrogenase